MSGLLLKTANGADGRHRFDKSLAVGVVEERRDWRLIGQGRGIHWPDLDEDITVENLLVG